MKKIFILLFTLLSLNVVAHEFWLQPDKFIYTKGQTANIKFRVGENFEGDNWNNNSSKINFLTLYQNGAIKNIAPLISEKNGDSLQLPLTANGTAMIVYNGLNSFIELEAEKFNAYLIEDGLKDAIKYRKEHFESDSASREYYQRSVKTILQVGNKKDTTFKIATLLPVDIIPLSHPYQINAKDTITFQFFFNKQPLRYSLVKVWQRINNKTMLQNLGTDGNGKLSFPITNKGIWMVSTVKMIRLEKDSKANWQSYWGSCTWGYE